MSLETQLLEVQHLTRELHEHIQFIAGSIDSERLPTWDWNNNVPEAPTLKDLFHCAAVSLALDSRSTLEWLCESHPKFEDKQPILYPDRSAAIRIIQRVAYGLSGGEFPSENVPD